MLGLVDTIDRTDRKSDMPRLTMLVAIAAVSFCAQPYAVADGVPKFDFRQSCHADVQAYQGGSVTQPA